MSDTPNHVASWKSDNDDLAANDRSRFRGVSQGEHIVEAALGNGLVQVTYVDCANAPEQAQR